MSNPSANPIKTPFYQYHVDAGAKIVDFAGFLMPVQYTGITAEHLAVRKSVGLFDLSHMGEFVVTGDDALAFLQKTTTNNVAALEIGQIQYSCMPYPEGGLVDDLLVYRTGPKEYFLVVNASNMQKDFDWLSSHLFGKVKLENKSDDYGLLAIQGPNAQKVMAQLTDYDLESMGYYTVATAKIAGIDLLFSRTGYTGEDGFEIYIPPAHCPKLWKAVTDAGKQYDMQLIGLGARDTLRLEAGLCLYGHDIDEKTSPVEAGLGWAIQKVRRAGGARAGGYPGAAVIDSHLAGAARSRRVGLLGLERVPVRAGTLICDAHGRKLGTVTSGTLAPSVDRPIAMAYLPVDHAMAQHEVYAEVRGRRLPMRVTPMPFHPHRYQR